MTNKPFTDNLISPYGDNLTNLLTPVEEISELKSYAAQLSSIQISERSICDLELLATGAFSPLTHFMGSEDYRRVLKEMRLISGHIFPIPIVLPVNSNPVIQLGKDIALRDSKNELLAVMTIEEIYEWGIDEASHEILGTTDSHHPFVSEMHRMGKLNISGKLRVIQLPPRYDFRELRMTPSQTRTRLINMRNPNVVAFQTRNPLHRVHEVLTKRASDEVKGSLLIHPVVGLTKPGDVDHYTRVRTYKALINNHYDSNRVLLALIPLAMRMAGPREALWHAIIRRNYGSNYLIVGRDHAGPGTDSRGNPYYGPYDAQEMVAQFSSEIGVGMVPFREFMYLPDENRYEEISKITSNAKTYSISGTDVRNEYLSKGKTLPEWFTRPEIAKIMADTFPPIHRQGVCIWFTGLSGSGKSTTAETLTILMMERGRHVTILDGDVVRTNLSEGLGFSKKDRDTNIRRIGFVASEIVGHGGLVICAAVSPYKSTREDVRNMIGKDKFIEVFVNTPISVCEKRDLKGMYSKARRGEIKGFTGIDDPYEAPEEPEITLDTTDSTAEANARLILDLLIHRGFVLDSSHNETKR